LYAPNIYALDEANGLMLLEDFGDDTFTRILADKPTLEKELYEIAIESLVKLHQIGVPDSLALGDYDISTLLEEASLLTQWFYPFIADKPLNAKQINQFDVAWQHGFSKLKTPQNVLVLRDYHVDNLMRIRLDDGHVKCGLLDFQDALIGSPAYDLASLLEDARRDISAELKTHCLNQYFSALSVYDNSAERTALIVAMNVFAAQRHAKVLGIFVRLYKRDKKAHYLKHLPRVLSLYEASLKREPLLESVAKWMTDYLPFDEIDLNTSLQKTIN
jgi:aminoglycoside/choline kinase family phosphotransferase